MSSNLDRSLDEILAARPKGAARGPRRATAPATAAVPGGISKRPQRAAARKATAQVTPNATKAAGKTPTGPKLKASKIIVSNLVSFIKPQEPHLGSTVTNIRDSRTM